MIGHIVWARWGTIALLLGALLSPCGVARGQDADGPPDPLLQQILSLNASKQYPQALELARQGLRGNPTHNHYLFQAADACTKMKDYAQAVHYFTLLTRYYPNIPQNFAYAGFNAYWGRDYEAAAKLLRRALRWSAAQLGPAVHAQARAYLSDVTTGRTYRIVWQLQPRADLLEGGRLRVPLPNSGLPYQHLDSYTLTGARSYTEVTESSGNHVLLVVPDGDNRLILTARVTCKTYSSRTLVSRITGGPPPAEAAAYLRLSYMANTDGVRVRKIAAPLKAADSMTTVRNIIQWLDANIHYELIGFESVDQILDRGYVACEGYSALFCSLCRACGVPAREVWGVCFPNTETGRLNGHGWSEVYLNGIGWFPVDATPPSKTDAPGPDYVQMGHYATAPEFRLWRNMVDMNIGPSTTASTPTFAILDGAGEDAAGPGESERAHH